MCLPGPAMIPGLASNAQRSSRAVMLTATGFDRRRDGIPMQMGGRLGRTRSQQGALPRYYGPIELREIPGRGRGLVLTQDVPAGELLLVSRPVACVVGTTRTADLLEALITQQMTAAQQQLLILSYGYQEPRDQRRSSDACGGHDTTATHVSRTPDLGDLHRHLSRLDHTHTHTQHHHTSHPRRTPPTPRQHPRHTRPTAARANQSHSTGPSEPDNPSTLYAHRTLRRWGTEVEKTQGTPSPVPRDAGYVAMLRRLLELNCFSEQDMEPALRLGTMQPHMDTGSTGSTEHSLSKAPDEIHSMSACEFLELAARQPAQSARDLSHAQHVAARDDLLAHVGLWVEHAWMNHACAPNVVNYVLGDAMVVRAGRDLPAGAELRDTYLGTELMLPVQERRAALRRYGFTCACERCRVEEGANSRWPALAPAIWALQRDLHSRWEPRARALMAGRTIWGKSCRHAAKRRLKLRGSHRLDRGSVSISWELLAKAHGQGTAALSMGRMADEEVVLAGSPKERGGWFRGLCRVRPEVRAGRVAHGLQECVERLQEQTDHVADLIVAAVHMGSADTQQQATAHGWKQEAEFSGSCDHQSTTDTLPPRDQLQSHEKQQQRYICMMQFCLHGCYDLLALCRRRLAAHASSAAMALKVSGKASMQAHAHAMRLHGEAVAASAWSEELAGQVVPGSRLHVDAATDAWMAAAAWQEVQGMLPQACIGNADSTNKGQDCHVNVHPSAATDCGKQDVTRGGGAGAASALEHAYGRLSEALTVRFGSLTDTASHCSGTGDGIGGDSAGMSRAAAEQQAAVARLVAARLGG